MLDETEAPCRIVPIVGEKDERKAPFFLALNPMGEPPPIVHRTTGG